MGSNLNVGESERALSLAAGVGLAVVGLAKGNVGGLLLAGVGGALAYRGLSGYCSLYQALGLNTAERSPATAVPAQAGYKVERTFTIRRSPQDLYGQWRNFENLPTFMKHLKKVEVLDHRKSRWTAQGPLGTCVSWDAEIINDRPGELIAWRSLPGSTIDTAGSVRFEPEGAAGSRLTLSLKYNPPAGKVGATLASLLGDGVEEQIEDDLNHFKREMERGRQLQTS